MKVNEIELGAQWFRETWIDAFEMDQEAGIGHQHLFLKPLVVRMGGLVLLHSKVTFEGLIVHSPWSFAIWLPFGGPRSSIKEGNMYIGMALGHFMMHYPGQDRFSFLDQSEKQEDAKRFARAFFMPEELFLKKVEETDDLCRNSKEFALANKASILSKFFGVPEWAIEQRMSDLKPS